VRGDGLGDDQPGSSSGDTDRYQAELQLHGTSRSNPLSCTGMSVLIQAAESCADEIRSLDDLDITDRTEFGCIDQRRSEIRAMHQTGPGSGEHSIRGISAGL
jgi:hypothetical protein